MNITVNTIKKYLKENGYDTKNIRVRVKYVGYGSTSISITILDLTLNAEEIERVVRKEFGSIRYDEHVQGEILEGCNTYVNCAYDYDVLERAIQEKYKTAEKIYNELKKQNTYNGIEIYENRKITAFAFFKDRSIVLMNKNKESSMRYRNHVLNNKYDLASALVTLENIGHFGKF